MSSRSESKNPVSRRRFLTTAAAGSVVSFAGCAANTNGGSGGDNNSSGSGATGSGGSTKLTYWHQEGAPHRVEQFKKYTNRFNKQHDNIQVEVEGQTWGSVFGKLSSALEAGNPPDFMFSLPAFTMTFQSRGALTDVSDIVSDIKKKHGMFSNSLRPFKYDGGTWGIPMWDMVFLDHYRSDTIGETDGWPPKNWNQWLQAATEVTGGGDYGICLPASKTLWTTENLYNLMIPNNAYVYGPEGKIMFNTPETVETLDFYKQMFKQASPPAATGWGWSQWATSLLQGTTYSTTGFSSWMRQLTETKYADNFSANQQPTPKNGRQGSVHYVNNIMVFNEKKKDAISTFVKWLHQKGTYGEWLANTEPTLYLPVTETGKNSDEFWNHPIISKYEESVRTQFNALPKAGVYGFRDIHTDLYLPSVGTLESSNVLAEVVQQLIVNDKSPKEAASWGQNRIQEVLGVGASSKLSQ